ncbi:sigma-E factor negative regulatory protein [Vibrio sp. HDW18]|uniref:sigma-E factor negative regulatory protein n=1 Tax=Vibrio sp. HDW18 TaxID=2714948 RepID=UPI001407AAD4|nr:sigma-E factor negative regulatory protein [Vibrio sp. HDW18]QIL85857.1 sigma-E factor negative regulatory protein [Vibrio sp. HDW18]
MADKQKLSALMDGEMIDNELILQLAHNPQACATWGNYHLIGDVLRGDAPVAKEWNIAESVALALENEPDHNLLRDKNHSLRDTHNVIDLQQAKLTEQPTPQQAKRQLPVWWSQLSQFGIAASVCLAVVFGVQQYAGQSSAIDGELPVLQTIPLAGSAEPVSLTRDSVEKHAPDSTMQEQRRRVNALLQDYELQLRLNSENAVSHQHSVESVAE